jgi:hypothetical protein
MLNLKFENIRYDKIRHFNRFIKHLSINMCYTTKPSIVSTSNHCPIHTVYRVWISDPLKYFRYVTVGRLVS